MTRLTHTLIVGALTAAVMATTPALTHARLHDTSLAPGLAIDASHASDRAQHWLRGVGGAADPRGMLAAEDFSVLPRATDDGRDERSDRPDIRTLIADGQQMTR